MSVQPTELQLPRLLYIGDIPVEASYYGSVILYRLLQDYPPEKLLIVEGYLVVSQPERRLPGVNYRKLRVGKQRWLNSRFHSWFSSWLSVTANSRVGAIPKLLADFQPEAVLTVTHGYSWLTAAQWAKQHNLPLHLILHDDWIRMVSVLKPVLRWLDGEFGRVYRQAASRLCVSPFMVEEYEHRYGLSGSVLYPSRGKDVVVPTEPVVKRREDGRSFTIVYAGTITNIGCVRALQTLAECLEELDGQLVIHGPWKKEDAIRGGLHRPNIRIGGFLPVEEFLEHIREEADVLFVPMSFDKKHKSWIRTSFPSKLTDYTATGLPLLIYGPPYCSAVRWARENPGVAEVVTRDEPQELRSALQQLCSLEYRTALAKMALVKGNEFFSYSQAQANFLTHLMKASSSPNLLKI